MGENTQNPFILTLKYDNYFESVFVEDQRTCKKMKRKIEVVAFNVFIIYQCFRKNKMLVVII